MKDEAKPLEVVKLVAMTAFLIVGTIGLVRGACNLCAHLTKPLTAAERLENDRRWHQREQRRKLKDLLVDEAAARKRYYSLSNTK